LLERVRLEDWVCAFSEMRGPGKMTPLDTIVRRELPVIDKIIADEVWL
jgi:hypothetical protein